jgi:hypothetical protein
MTMGWEDYEAYETLYNYVSAINLVIGPSTGGVDFDDQALYGISAANASHRVVQPVLEGVWVDAGNASAVGSLATRLVLQMHMPADAVQNAGAFETVFVALQLDVTAAPAASLSLTLTGFNKTSTRLPEALFLRFRPQPKTTSGARQLRAGPSVSAAPSEALHAVAKEFASRASLLASGKERILLAKEFRDTVAAMRRAPEHRRAQTGILEPKPVGAETGSSAAEGMGSWCLNKLERWLSPWPIAWGGSTRIHAVSDAGVAFVPSLPAPNGADWSNGSVVAAAITSATSDPCADALAPQAAASSVPALRVASLDAAVVCVGEETALPIPTTSAPDFEAGVSFVLHNNAWATNYAAFIGQPMPAGGPPEDDFAWRFTLAL